MLVGVPKEIKNHEYRTGLTPASVRELTARGHSVLVEAGLGQAIGLGDGQYAAAGARVAATAREVWERADLIVKVKEPQAAERALLREGQVLFTYLHLAPDPQQAADLVRSRAVCIAYETVTAPGGGLPLLAPMSEVAGRLAVQAGAAHLELPAGGMGVLLAGVPGVPPAHVVVIGAGVVGSNALQMAVGAGARVTVIDRNVQRLRELDLVFGNRVETRFSTVHGIEAALAEAELVIGAVLVPGAAAPKLVTRAMLAKMKRGAVLVDVAIDQGGCFETSRPTTHAQPTFVVDGIIHYCVANMPGAVARTSAHALNNATLPFVLALADQGWQRALAGDPHLRAGLNVCRGAVTHAAVAAALGYEWRDPADFLA
ncbi:alanine dehydrogenase [Ramlibacter sp.]|uniref:alanine dehydrogenase n=1 Tax=Ramlibacter sp. TaxID=1917967 RepID=UPI002C723E55|nr:alanine dehydrogenase [Ramlibacter sp.]HWI81150.1 alanine dehydrogenase [Ramlibacter sp.]